MFELPRQLFERNFAAFAGAEDDRPAAVLVSAAARKIPRRLFCRWEDQ